MSQASKLQKEIAKHASLENAKVAQSFFKTGKGEYGFGDIFIGVKVPILRLIAKEYQDLSIDDLGILIKSKIHEHRLMALVILVNQFKRATSENQKRLFNFYLKNKANINNWDLVDISAPGVVGAYLFDKDRSELYRLVKSKVLWDRRIAIISTFYFIRQNDFKDTLKLSEILLSDKHDLMHKAVGWMLREVGKKDIKAMEKFLDKNISQMPRTALRYAIERMPETKRLFYLKA
jgi:3-methyladenine DNA glycosylase AlkD